MARRLTPTTATEQQPAVDPAEQQEAAQQSSNVTDETVLHHLKKVTSKYAAMQKAKDAYDTAKGIYRAACADAEASGVEYLPKYLRMKKREPEDIDRETRALTRLAILDGFPIGTQLGLVPDGSGAVTTAASFVDQNKLALQEEDAEVAGKKAGLKGKPVDNPYPKNSRKGIRWAVGWDAGQAQNKENLGKGPNPEPPLAA